MKSSRPRWEWPLVIGLVLLAFFFRVWQLNDVPPGLHHDEVIIGQVAKDILRGNFAIYFTAGYGHEPLYHYLVAGFFALIGASAFTLRLTSAFVAVLGLVAAYRLTRRLFSPGVALGMLAWMSISLWPVFFARVGLRGITLPLLTTLTAYFLWMALHTSRFTNYIVAGALLGLTIYTYQASRVFPIIFAVFFVYLAVTQTRSRTTPHAPRFELRGSIVFLITALIVAAPLIIYLAVINPRAEERVADLSGPLNQLRAGDPSEVISSTLNTLSMFTIKGDAVPIYNVGGRPVFPEPIGAALFYLGLLICLWRWKQPAYAFMLIWFVISLAPAMVTPFSPNFVRTMAAWPVPFVLVGVGMESIGRLVTGQLVTRSKRYLVTSSPCHLVIGFLGLVLALNAVLTYRDYFLDWPRGDYVRFWQQATWTQAVRAINADASTAPVVASGLSIQDFDPQTFDLLGVRSDVNVKWADCRQAVLYPHNPTIRYLQPALFPCDADLWSLYVRDAKLLIQRNWPDTHDRLFALYEFERPRSLDDGLARRAVVPSVYIGAERFTEGEPLQAIDTWVDFGGLRFYGLWLPQFTQGLYVPKPGDTVILDTGWTVEQPVAPPLKIFIHVTAPDGRIVAQWDGLDVNVGTLAADDVFIQRHRINLPADLPSGAYRISLGIYRPDTGERLTAQLGERVIDSIVLGPLYVK